MSCSSANFNARAKAAARKKSMATAKSKGKPAGPPVVHTEYGTLAFPQADSLGVQFSVISISKRF